MVSCRRSADCPAPGPAGEGADPQAPLTDGELQQLRAVPSEPEVLAEAAGTGVAVFDLDRNGRDAGLVFWLGTRGYLRPFRSPMLFAQLNVSSFPGLAAGREDAVVGRVVQECRTADAPGCWVCVDVGRSRALRPTHVAFTHGCPRPGHDLTTWALEGRDPTTGQWDILVKALPPLQSAHSTLTVPMHVGNSMYSQMRVISTGTQLDGTHTLHLSNLELWGTLFLL